MARSLVYFFLAGAFGAGFPCAGVAAAVLEAGFVAGVGLGAGLTGGVPLSGAAGAAGSGGVVAARGGGGLGGFSSFTFSSSACVGADFGTPSLWMPCCA